MLSVVGPEQADWCAIYQPMAKYLTASFRHLLQVRDVDAPRVPLYIYQVTDLTALLSGTVHAHVD